MKLTISINLKNIDKNRIVHRKYVNKAGVEVEQSMYSMEIVPLKDSKVVKEADTWALVKSHFVTNAPTKEERANKDKMQILGDGMEMRDKQTTAPIEVTKQAIRQDMNKIANSTLTAEELAVLESHRNAHKAFNDLDGINAQDIPFD